MFSSYFSQELFNMPLLSEMMWSERKNEFSYQLRFLSGALGKASCISPWWIKRPWVKLLLSCVCQAKGIGSLVRGQLMWWVTHRSRTGASLLSPTAAFGKGLCHQVWVERGATVLLPVVQSDLGEFVHTNGSGRVLKARGRCIQSEHSSFKNAKPWGILKLRCREPS